MSDAAIDGLLKMGAQNVVVTLGEKGALWATPSEMVRVDAMPVKAVDTVGAGDTFCGALVASLAQGESFLDAIRFANAAAAISVTRHGAQASAPHRAEVLVRLQQSAELELG